jgi:hypothetical protein
MPTSDIDLLSMCADFTLSHSASVQENILKELQTSARTPLVTGLRMLSLQRAILVTGMFSLFEGLLQSSMGWKRPFDSLKEYLQQGGQEELAQKFDDYKLAINVLKHGRGPSYDSLLSRASELEFRIKATGEGFFDEGDVSEVAVLVLVDDQFVKRCAALIQEATAIIRSRDRVLL